LGCLKGTPPEEANRNGELVRLKIKRKRKNGCKRKSKGTRHRWKESKEVV